MSSWDDGKHSKVKKVTITFGDVINSVEFEYDSNGNTFKSQRRGSVGSKSDGFTLAADEYITDVSGYTRTKANGEEVVTALKFKTNKDSYGPYGNVTRDFFTVNSPSGSQVVGFNGTSGDALSSIDVHFGPITSSGTGSSGTGGSGGSGSGGSGSGGTGSGSGGSGGSGSGGSDAGGSGGPGTGGSGSGGSGGSGGSSSGGAGGSSGPEKVEAQGGKVGKEWDDGANNDSVRKISVGIGRKGIHYVKFDYEKGGQLNAAPVRGSTDGTTTKLFEIAHPDEYLVSVVGYHEDDIIQSLQFKTNKKQSEVFGYEGAGTMFTIEIKDKKIVGFHGLADKYLNSLGAYLVAVTSTPVNKLEAQGGKGSTTFDDGTFDGVRKVHVGQGDSGVSYIVFEYEKDGKLETRDHGKKTLLGTEEFVLKSGDYITSIEGYHDKIFGYPSEVITSLTFKTFFGETSQPFGVAAGTKFVLDGQGGKLVGFHGSFGDAIHSLGAYFTQASTPIKKLEAQGGKGSTTFDDGTFDDVRKVHVGQGDSGVSYVVFEYEKGGKLETRDHGKKTLLGTEEFALKSGDYITSIEGYHDKIFGYTSEVITSLTFKTFTGETSQPFGVAAGTKFVLDGQGGKLVGFHGSFGDAIHSLGAYFAPATTPLTPAN